MTTPWSVLGVALVLGSLVATLVAGCVSSREETVSMAQLSAHARATVLKETAGGSVDSIVKEIEKGKVVYDVEATVGGKHAEFLISDTDGAVLGTETQIEFSELPEPVRAAGQRFFGSPDGLTIMKGVEYGETHYEIEGKRKGKIVEVTFDPAGKRTE